MSFLSIEAIERVREEDERDHLNLLSKLHLSPGSANDTEVESLYGRRPTRRKQQLITQKSKVRAELAKVEEVELIEMEEEAVLRFWQRTAKDPGIIFKSYTYPPVTRFNSEL